jgi:hypothetical protein
MMLAGVFLQNKDKLFLCFVAETPKLDRSSCAPLQAGRMTAPLR